MADSKQVNIPKKLYDGLKKRVDETEFKTVDEYATYVLEQVLEQIYKKQDTGYSKEDEEKVKERLKSLGYLD